MLTWKAQGVKIEKTPTVKSWMIFRTGYQKEDQTQLYNQQIYALKGWREFLLCCFGGPGLWGRETWLYLFLAKRFTRSIGCLSKKHSCHSKIHQRRCVSSQTVVRLIPLSKRDLFSNAEDRYWTALLRMFNYPEAQRGFQDNQGMENSWSLAKNRDVRGSETRAYTPRCKGSKLGYRRCWKNLKYTRIVN